MSRFKIGDRVKEINYNPRVRPAGYPNIIIPEMTDAVVIKIEQNPDGETIWVRQGKIVIGIPEADLVKI